MSERPVVAGIGIWHPDRVFYPIAEQRKVGEYLVANDVAGIVALAQMDVLEIHTWNSSADDVERPDRIVIDLDPGDGVAWREVIAAARLVRERLRALPLASWVKTTGGKGLHVVVALLPAADCRAASPRAWAGNTGSAGSTNTSIAAFSTRAGPGAPVSLPLSWTQLSRVDPRALTVRTVPDLLRRRRDPWAGYWRCRQQLAPKMVRILQP